ncbi:betaine/proline/choline family ABC transporter ATP-binding protein [Virgibacillus sp. NKC19-3]|uniref:betaine/proline/choline family ABC transporter ATP-binding protein n=1 Tax=Virgibacillus saliphilus TaxID=2831674 RepID=UPI001C9B688F|nr:betaine/proline/choline family ABC transporter ATP-binding protein [Virgibacillus sp. NKC19-3]MBY7144385.1 betaine/proline/choline family ABC transporter ATP-binding protein [Virgibacillus sp. NKC19-3]
MISLKKVSKVYDDGFQALKNIDLTFEEGQINVLIGPSGCGKTTTMKLLNRLTAYTDGEIMINGKNLKDTDPIELRRQMGYVIQNIGLFPHMSISKNIATVPKLLKWDNERIKKRVDELLEMVDLPPNEYRHRYPSELSGGQQQRVGVIRALAAEPSTILMDEPFSALDPISREQLQDELVRLQKEINKTIIFVTHDMDEAIKIADQIILMQDGHIVQKGTPKEILTNPVNDFVKEFIGEDRLGSMLPSLSDFVEKNAPTVTLSQSVKKAVELMVDCEFTEIPVVDEKGKFIGMLGLYHTLNNMQMKLGELIDDSIKPIKQKMETGQLIHRFNESRFTIYPVLSDDGRVEGIVQRSKMYQLLNQFYEHKSGGQSWN